MTDEPLHPDEIPDSFGDDDDVEQDPGEFPKELLAKYGLSPTDLNDYKSTVEKIFALREEFKQWNNRQGREPKFNLRLPAETVIKLEGQAAFMFAYLHTTMVKSGAYDSSKFLKSIVALGAAALYEQHKESLAFHRVLTSLGQAAPGIVDALNRILVIRGARMHKQMQSEAFDDLIQDFRSTQSRKDP